MLLGYGRVSTRDQNPDSQRDRLTAAGRDRLYIDKVSGSLDSRPELDKMMDGLREGDVVVFTKLDRLGRSVKMLKQMVEYRFNPPLKMMLAPSPDGGILDLRAQATLHYGESSPWRSLGHAFLKRRA